MYVDRLNLSNFRNYGEAELVPSTEGVTLLRGDNGAGKTNLLEAISYTATLKSFRGVPSQALVRAGQPQAVIRAAAHREGRALLVEIELHLQGRDKLQLNRQPVRRAEDVLNTVLVTVFSPDDIEIVKGGPQYRRDFLDDLLVPLHPKYAAARNDLERALRQRNALLRSAGGFLRPGMASTLDVWDTKLAIAGEQIASARSAAMGSLAPEVTMAYRVLSDHRMRPATKGNAVAVSYLPSWQGELLKALEAARAEDVRRGVTSVGPHRDDLGLLIDGLPARVQASQGEQRALALALRLASHRIVSNRQATKPVLLLDDIFSELDPARSGALAASLPPGQTLLASAGPVPAELAVARLFHVRDGALEPA